MAEEITQPITLLDDFQALPEAIKNWLASGHTTDIIAGINKKLGIKEARRSIIPGLLLRLIVRDLEPQDFINELSGELKINYPTAKALTEEIESKILKPIENPLQEELSIDMKLLYAKAAAEIPAAIPQPQTPIRTPAITQAAPRQESPAPKTQATEPPEIKPRVIYKERTLGPVLPPLSAEALPEKALAAEQSQNPAKPSSISIKPISVRVVHYNSAPAAALNNPKSEAESEFDSFTVDLRTI